ncbi:MAG: hypothetical protein ABFR90_03410 [Planctomycetota bacterium]
MKAAKHKSKINRINMSASPRLLALIISACLLCCSCGKQNTAAESDVSNKITFDLEQFNEEGLRGPPDGLVALDYEFCIPDTEKHKQQVRSIDLTVRFMCGSRGRIGCDSTECLCVGSTHQENFRQVLLQLAALDYIERIDWCVWE